MTRLRAGIGTSALDDAAAAGRAAAAAAAADLAARGAQGQPALVIVYTSVRYDLPVLLSGVREVTGETLLVGATTAAHFQNGDLTPARTGVSVMIMTSGSYRFGVASGEGLRADAFEVGRAVARAARAAVESSGPAESHNALLLLTDGLAGHQQALLNGIHRVAGAAVPVVGGAAGDDRRMQETFVFCGDRVLTDATVAVWITSAEPLHVVTGHGWRPVGLPLLVTRVEESVVHEIAGRPAMDVYEEHLRYGGVMPDVESDGLQPSRRAVHALAVIEPSGAQLIRSIYLAPDGLIRSFTPLPHYAAVQVVSGVPDDLLAASKGVVDEVFAGREPGVLLAFSCLTRLEVLAERSHEEPARIQAAAGTTPTFGFYTLGEFARTTTVAGFHNATIAAIAL
ncbi:FIST signal transduction protein [Planosporangium mesophilum]|uniref:FIST signal transduction protein n=1 Tax=Planosporangium mesophilum TaxID=689768 RepID=UPI00143996B2|nr:FIST N-terminal domain-containing protein [Planosporangium mesophilum]NJC85939.1 hypothetical protein [Planosporangium mesophilum]